MIKKQKTLIRPQMYKMVSTFVEDGPLTGLKAERAETIHTATVMCEGMTFDADETSMNRMGRWVLLAAHQHAKSLAEGSTAAEAYADAYTTPTVQWKLADNTVQTVSIKQLAEAYRLAVANMQSSWL